MIPQQETLLISEEKFFFYLVNLRKYKEFDLLEKCLNMNSIRINDSDLENWLKHKDYNPDKITLRRNNTDDFLIKYR